jgi:hypothetical protein
MNTDNMTGRRFSRKSFLLWSIAAAVVVAGTVGAIVFTGINGTTVEPSSANSSADQRLAPPDASQRFEGTGFTVGVPPDWRIERAASDSVALYDHDPAASDASSTICKIEVSAFPFSPSPDGDVGAWITARIGADPSLAIVEESSGDVAVDGGTGVRWNGTIDGVPTTLVYAFGASHAYEIAPSVVATGSSSAEFASDGAGSVPCDGALDTFLSSFSVQ